MRVTVRGHDGELVAGEHQLFDDEDRPAYLVLGTDVTVTSDAAISSWSFDTYPVHTSLTVHEPGRYHPVLHSPGYAERHVTLDPRTGEDAETDVTLSR